MRRPRLLRKRIRRRPYRPPWWLRNGHLQSMLSQIRPVGSHPYRDELLALPDGDEMMIRWTARRDGPVVIVMPGTECGLEEAHTQGLLQAVHRHGGRGVALPFRGVGPGRWRNPTRTYHGADHADLDHLVRVIRDREGDVPLFIVGCSLGGSAMLHWLADLGPAASVAAAMAVSVPFHLPKVIHRVSRTLGGFYNSRLLSSAKRRALKRLRKMDAPPVSIERVRSVRTLAELDAVLNAPLWGFDDVDAYYARTDSTPTLRSITRPTLLVHALDDPFSGPELAPVDIPVSPAVQREILPHGGHLGFIDQREDGSLGYWLEDRLLAWMDEHLEPEPA